MARPRKKPLLQLDENDPLRCLLSKLVQTRTDNRQILLKTH